jgi:PIN domain nuclease of toxin-antitoxin system
LAGGPLKLLLDTHIWIWTQLATSKLSARAEAKGRGAVAHVQNDVCATGANPRSLSCSLFKG